MEYCYLIETKQKKLNKKKVVIAIILALLLISLAIWGGISLAKNNHTKRQIAKEERLKLEAEEQERIRQEEIKNEEIRKAQEMLETNKQKALKPLTEEQVKAIENIYSSDEKSVFLTFDDGPTKSVTPLILDLLKQENIKATFFVLGTMVKNNPDIIKREYEEGHFIANHSHTHKYGRIYANVQSVFDEYNTTQNNIREAIGNPNFHTNVFRFPGGSVGGYYKSVKSKAKQELRKKQIASLDWNALTKDAEGAHTKESILENIKNTVGDKKTVVLLMHDASDKILTYETLPDVIKFFRDNGYTFKNIYDII